MSNQADRCYFGVRTGAAMAENSEIRGRVSVTIGMCFLAAILEGYDIQAFGIAAPKLVAALSLNPAEQGWAASAAMIGLVFGAFTGGRVADAMGRKPVLLISVALFGIGALWTATSGSFLALLPARFVTGLGFGGAYPVLIAIAAEVSAPSRRSAVTCALFCGMPAGGSLVSLFANIAGEQLDWRMIFVVGGALPLAILPLLWFFLTETRPSRDDSANARLMPALFEDGRATATILLASASFLALVVLYLILNWLPSLVVAKGYLSGDGAAASFAFNITGVLGALLLGFLADIAGVRRALVLAYATTLVSLYFLGAAQSVLMIVVYSGLLGLFASSVSFVLYGLAPTLYPVNVRAAAAGAIVGVGRLGTIAGPLLAGQLRQIGWSAESVIDAMLPIVVLGAVCAITLTSRFRQPIADVGDHRDPAAAIQPHPGARGPEVTPGDHARIRPWRQCDGRAGIEFVAVAGQQQAPAGMGIPGEGDNAHAPLSAERRVAQAFLHRSMAGMGSKRAASGPRRRRSNLKI